MFVLEIIIYIDFVLMVGILFLVIFIFNCSLILVVRKFNKKYVWFSDRKFYFYLLQYSILIKVQI